MAPFDDHTSTKETDAGHHAVRDSTGIDSDRVILVPKLPRMQSHLGGDEHDHGAPKADQEVGSEAGLSPANFTLKPDGPPQTAARTRRIRPSSGIPSERAQALKS